MQELELEKFVEDLRALGVKEAFGSDLVVSKEMHDKGYFFAENMRATHFPNKFFDVIVTTVSYFFHYARYGGDVAGRSRKEVLNEFYRLCNINCDVYIGSVGPEIFDLVKDTGFEVVNFNAATRTAHLQRTQDLK